MGYSDDLPNRDIWVKGLPASRGVAVGNVLRLDESGRHQFYYIEVPTSGVRSEIKRMREAFVEARAQLNEIKKRLTKELGSQQAYILDVHLLMLEDKKLLAELERHIRKRKISAEWAVREVADRIAGVYRQVKDPYLRER